MGRMPTQAQLEAGKRNLAKAKRWQKGKSGNPAGRPPKPKPGEIKDIRELARSHCREAIETLAAVCKDNRCPPGVRVSAATALLDRGFGRPVQPVEADMKQKHEFDLGIQFVRALENVNKKAKQIEGKARTVSAQKMQKIKKLSGNIELIEASKDRSS